MTNHTHAVYFTPLPSVFQVSTPEKVPVLYEPTS